MSISLKESNDSVMLILPMNTSYLRAIATAYCLGAFAACGPTEPPPPIKTSETATVEEKISRFKSDPSKANMDEVEKALANLNVEIKELEVREAKVGGAEKDEATRKLTDLRAKVQRLQHRLHRRESESERYQGG